MRWGGWMQDWAASRGNSASGEVVKDVFFLLSLMFISIISDRCLASWWWPWFEVTVSSVAVLLARRTEHNVHSLFLTNWKQLQPNLPWHCQVEAKERKNRMKSLWVHSNFKKKYSQWKEHYHTVPKNAPFHIKNGQLSTAFWHCSVETISSRADSPSQWHWTTEEEDEQTRIMDVL